MTSRITTVTMVGRMNGIDTCLNRRQAPAPSSAAASCSSRGTPVSAARKISIDQPTPFQTPSAPMATIAVHRCPSQLTGWPTTPSTSTRNQLTTPWSVANRYWNSSDTTTQLVTTGR